jgi:hypothetical protein
MYIVLDIQQKSPSHRTEIRPMLVMWISTGKLHECRYERKKNIPVFKTL